MNDKKRSSKLSGSGLLALVVLVGFLSLAVWFLVTGWNSLSDVKMSGFGWFALIAGSLITFGVGAGLMALVFYSSRHNMDR
jgi:hypothetical protein